MAILPTEQQLIEQGSRPEDIKSIDNKFFYDRSGVNPEYVHDIYKYYLGGGEPGTAGDIAAEAALVPGITAPATGDQGQGTSGGVGAPVVTDNTQFEQNLIDQGAGVQIGRGPVVAPGEIPMTQQEMDDFNKIPVSVDYADPYTTSGEEEYRPTYAEQLEQLQATEAENAAIANARLSGSPYFGDTSTAPTYAGGTATLEDTGAIDSSGLHGAEVGFMEPAATDPYRDIPPIDYLDTQDDNWVEAVKPTDYGEAEYRPTYAEQIEDDLMEYDEHYDVTPDEEKSLLDKALGVVTSLPTPLNLAKRAIDKIPESKSQIEYESYSPEQKQAIDEAYGTGGVMEGYNPVSIAGKGVEATVEERLDDINKALANPDRVVRDDVYVTDKDGNKIFNPSYNSLEKQKARLEEFKNNLGPQPSNEGRGQMTTAPSTQTMKEQEWATGSYTSPTDVPDAYTILGEEGVKQGVGPKYSDELNWRDQAQHTFGSPAEPSTAPSTQTMKEQEWATGSYTSPTNEGRGQTTTTTDDSSWEDSFTGGTGEGEFDSTTTSAAVADAALSGSFTTGQPTSSGSSSGGCFLKGTQVTMADGSTKAIEQVDLGDKVAEGGKVFATGKFLVDNLHDYRGIKVSGSHMVNEDGNWTRVEDSKHGKALGDEEHTVYVFGAENRRILINNILFTDYFEVKEKDKLLNNEKDFFKNWKLYAKQDSGNNVDSINAS